MKNLVKKINFDILFASIWIIVFGLMLYSEITTDRGIITIVISTLVIILNGLTIVKELTKK